MGAGTVRRIYMHAGNLTRTSFDTPSETHSAATDLFYAVLTRHTSQMIYFVLAACVLAVRGAEPHVPPPPAPPTAPGTNTPSAACRPGEDLVEIQSFVTQMTLQDISIFNNALFVAWVAVDVCSFAYWKSDSDYYDWHFYTQLTLHVLDILVSAIMCAYTIWQWITTMGLQAEDPPCATAWFSHEWRMDYKDVQINDGLTKLAFTMLVFSSEFFLASIRGLCFKTVLWVARSKGSADGEAMSSESSCANLALRCTVALSILGSFLYTPLLVGIAVSFISFFMGFPLVGLYIVSWFESIAGIGLAAALTSLFSWVRYGECKVLNTLSGEGSLETGHAGPLDIPFVLSVGYTIFLAPVMRFCGNALLLSRTSDYGHALGQTYGAYFTITVPTFLNFTSFHLLFNSFPGTLIAITLIISLVHYLVKALKCGQKTNNLLRPREIALGGLGG